MLEIEKMLTLSTEHITKKSFNWLLKQTTEPSLCELVVYKKDNVGVFISIDKTHHNESKSDIPKDIKNIIKFALENDCLWICLDRDGLTTSSLPTYEWK